MSFDSITIVRLIIIICSTGLCTMLFTTLPNFIHVHRIVYEKMHLKHEKNGSYGKHREERSKGGVEP